MYSWSKIWGLARSPISQVFKKLPTHKYIDLSDRGDGYWEADDIDIKDLIPVKATLDSIAQKAFPITPANFLPTSENVPVAVMDGLKTTNQAFTLNNNQVSAVQMEWYSNHGFIGFQSCAIIAQEWLVNRACSIPGKDAIRNGYKITSNSGPALKPEVIQDVFDLDEQFELNTHMKQFCKFRRVFGIRIILFVVKSKDKKYYEKPFNIDGVTEGSYQGMVQVDPYWITPELDGDAAANPASMYFYEPTYWRINGRLYHRTHLIINRYAEVPDVLKPNYLYGGIPLTQMIYERVYAAERGANEAPELLLTKRLYVVKTNTIQALAKLGAFIQRMNVFSGLKNNQGIQVIDKQEELEQKDTNLTHVKETIEGQYEIVAGISEIPISKLMGREIKGMGNKGDGERRNYTDVLEDEQLVLDPLVNRHHLILMKSHVEPKRGAQPRICHTWNDVNTPTDKEASEIRKNDAETAAKYVDMGAIDGTEVRNKLAADEESGYSLDTAESDTEDMDYSDYREEESSEQTFPNSQIVNNPIQA